MASRSCVATLLATLTEGPTLERPASRQDQSGPLKCAAPDTTEADSDARDVAAVATRALGFTFLPILLRLADTQSDNVGKDCNATHQDRKSSTLPAAEQTKQVNPAPVWWDPQPVLDYFSTRGVWAVADYNDDGTVEVLVTYSPGANVAAKAAPKLNGVSVKVCSPAEAAKRDKERMDKLIADAYDDAESDSDFDVQPPAGMHEQCKDSVAAC